MKIEEAIEKLAHEIGHKDVYNNLGISDHLKDIAASFRHIAASEASKAESEEKIVRLLEGFLAGKQEKP